MAIGITVALAIARKSPRAALYTVRTEALASKGATNVAEWTDRLCCVVRSPAMQRRDLGPVLIR